MSDEPRDDDRTREMSLPGRTASADPEVTRLDDAPPAGPTAPQPLPSGSAAPPDPAKVTVEQPLPSAPEARPADATAPQAVPAAPADPPPSGEAKVTAPQALPEAPGGPGTPPAPDPAAPVALPPPTPPPVVPPPVPLQQPVPGVLGPRPAGWHRFHYPIGIFLVAYGLTTVLFSVLGWSAHRREMAEYLGDGTAAPALAAVKVVQVLLVAVALAGLVRRRDVWFLPALAGWAAGFAVFCVLDGVKGRTGDLVEHGAFLVAFAALLCVSYALGVKARVTAARPPDQAGPPPGPGQLSRTQEIALAALNRWQRPAVDPQGPQGPQGPPPYTPQGAPPPPYGRG